MQRTREPVYGPSIFSAIDMAFLQDMYDRLKDHVIRRLSGDGYVGDNDTSLSKELSDFCARGASILVAMGWTNTGATREVREWYCGRETSN